MVNIEDYVARIEETCGEEKNLIVTFKYDRKDEVVKRILKNAKMEKSVSGIIFELTFGNASFRLYSSGKAIFRNLKDKDELKSVLSGLLV